MSNQDPGFDFHRYRKLLAEADDEQKRLALIDILVDERARDRLAAQRSHDLVRKVIGSRAAPDQGKA